jgi:hypothetical protein
LHPTASDRLNGQRAEGLPQAAPRGAAHGQPSHHPWRGGIQGDTIADHDGLAPERLCSGKSEAYAQLCNLFDQQTQHGRDMKAYDTLLLKAVDSLAATFRKRATTVLQSGRGFVLPSAQDHVHEKTDLDLVTRLVIRDVP